MSALPDEMTASLETPASLAAVGAETPPAARPSRYWAWVGMHGGAGVTTLAEVVPGGVEVGRRDALGGMAEASGLPVVAVCRSHAHGFRCAQRFARDAAGRDVTILGLVVVADIPERRRPKELAGLLHAARGAYPHAWEVPWVAQWRLGEPPAAANCPGPIPALLRDLWNRLGVRLPAPANRANSGP